MTKFKKWLCHVFQLPWKSSEPAPKIAMVNFTSIIGADEPEKLAEGICPNCKAAIDLWLSSQGFELSLNSLQDMPEHRLYGKVTGKLAMSNTAAKTSRAQLF